MASTCISSCCTKDIVDSDVYPIIPRANYTNLYKRPESDAEFMLRSINSKKGIKITDHSDNGNGNGSGRFLLAGAGDYEPRVVDSLSCRQMYLRSYTFSREEEKSTTSTPVNSTLPEKTRKCLEIVMKKVKLLRRKSISRAAAFDDGSSDLKMISLSSKRKKSIGYFVGRRKRVLVVSRELICRVKLSYSAILRMLRRLVVGCVTNAARITGGC